MADIIIFVMEQDDKQLAAYYAARAAEYEQVYGKPERQTDLTRLKQLIASYFIERDVLEIACGTGYWTQSIAPVARKVTAIDINSETLAIARSKRLAAERISFEVVDVQHLPPRYKAFTAVRAAGVAYAHLTRTRWAS